VNIELLYFEGCPNWRTVEERLASLQPELGFTLTRRLVSTSEDAERLGFRGSPTILVDGVDPFVSGIEPGVFACRVYQTPDGPAGSPTVGQLKDAVSERFP
jgi:hypothetical protein